MPQQTPRVHVDAPAAKLRRLRELQSAWAAQEHDDIGRRRRELLEKYPHPLALAMHFDDTVVSVPAMEYVSRALVDTLHTDNGRLTLSLPSQVGKTFTTRWFILWALLDNPNRRCIFSSYSMVLARTSGRHVRDFVVQYGAPYGLELDESHHDAADWQLKGYAGGLLSATPESTLTGRPSDCVTGDTELLTPDGIRLARDLNGTTSQRVLSFNHTTGRAEFRRIVATRRIERRPLVEITTTSGRRIRCTPDHRVYSANGYRQASLLRPGDQLVAAPYELSGMRRPDQHELVGDMPELLHGSQGQHADDDPVHTVRDRVPADARRAREEAAEGANQPVLLLRVPASLAVDTRQWPLVPSVRSADRAGQREEVLHASVRPGSSRRRRAEDDVPDMRHELPPQELAQGLLLDPVQGQRALGQPDRSVQLSLQRRHQLRRVVQADASADHRAGRVLPRVWRDTRAAALRLARQACDAFAARGASHRRGPAPQLAGESDPALLSVPRDPSPVANDTVRMVRRVRGAGEPVYDFQVEGNRNFFAGEVLVHNCMILDDLHAGEAEANSTTMRDRVTVWWESTARVRMAPGTPAIAIGTRFSYRDILSKFIKEGWQRVNIPALADGQETLDSVADVPGARTDDGYLITTRGHRPDDWRGLREEMGERAWSALAIGNPVPVQGGVYMTAWFDAHRRTELDQSPTLTAVFVDPAETGLGDAAGILVAARLPDAKVAVLADYTEKLSAARWGRKVCLAWMEWNASRVVQERTLGLASTIPDAWSILHRQATALANASGSLHEEAQVNRAVKVLFNAGDTVAANKDQITELVPHYQAVLDHGPNGPRVVTVTPKMSKRARAESVASAWETGRAFLVGTFPEMEWEAVTWAGPPAPSPNRLDTMVMATAYLEQAGGRATMARTPRHLQAVPTSTVMPLAR